MKKCSECNHSHLSMTRGGGRHVFYCLHPESRTECLPHNIIARSRGTVLPIKTSPKWCPLKDK